VPGVLEGSRGPLLYPPDEVAKNVGAWNGMPLVVYHPESDGSHTSARNPSVLTNQGVGTIFNTVSNGKLSAEAWFDEGRTRNVDRRVLAMLEKGEKIEISTGLYTDNEPAENGATHEGRPYTFVARNYRPDHVAVLPDQKGACSLKDGCGIYNESSSVALKNYNPSQPRDSKGKFGSGGGGGGGGGGEKVLRDRKKIPKTGTKFLAKKENGTEASFVEVTGKARHNKRKPRYTDSVRTGRGGKSELRMIRLQNWSTLSKHSRVFHVTENRLEHLKNYNPQLDDYSPAIAAYNAQSRDSKGSGGQATHYDFIGNQSAQLENYNPV
jgi:hypothetical protein